MALSNIILDDVTFYGVSQDATDAKYRADGSSYNLQQSLVLHQKAMNKSTKTRSVQMKIDFPEIFSDLNEKKTIQTATASLLVTVPVNASTVNVQKLTQQMADLIVTDVAKALIINGRSPT